MREKQTKIPISVSIETRPLHSLAMSRSSPKACDRTRRVLREPIPPGSAEMGEMDERLFARVCDGQNAEKAADVEHFPDLRLHTVQYQHAT